MRKKLSPIRRSLFRSIDLMQAIMKLDDSPWKLDWDGETLVFGRANVIADELRAWDTAMDRPTLDVLARMVWNSAVQNADPTTWFLKRFRPETALIALMFTVSEIPLTRLLTAELTENDFHRINCRIVQLTQSALDIRSMSSSTTIRNASSRRRKRKAVVVCDWVPSPDEIGDLQKVGVRVLAPNSPPEWR